MARIVHTEQRQVSYVDGEDASSAAPQDSDLDSELSSLARQQFEQAFDANSNEGQSERALNPLQFAFQLLSRKNNAVAREGDAGLEQHDLLSRPLTHYWNASSHNVLPLLLEPRPFALTFD